MYYPVIIRVGYENKKQFDFCIGYSSEKVTRQKLLSGYFRDDDLEKIFLKYKICEELKKKILQNTHFSRGSLVIFSPDYTVNKIDPYLE